MVAFIIRPSPTHTHTHTHTHTSLFRAMAGALWQQYWDGVPFPTPQPPADNPLHNQALPAAHSTCTPVSIEFLLAFREGLEDMVELPEKLPEKLPEDVVELPKLSDNVVEAAHLVCKADVLIEELKELCQILALTEPADVTGQ